METKQWTRDEYPMKLGGWAGAFGLITTPIDLLVQFHTDVMIAILGGVIVGGVLFFAFYVAGWIYASLFVPKEGATDDPTE